MVSALPETVGRQQPPLPRRGGDATGVGGWRVGGRRDGEGRVNSPPPPRGGSTPHPRRRRRPPQPRPLRPFCALYTPPSPPPTSRRDRAPAPRPSCHPRAAPATIPPCFFVSQPARLSGHLACRLAPPPGLRRAPSRAAPRHRGRCCHPRCGRTPRPPRPTISPRVLQDRPRAVRAAASHPSSPSSSCARPIDLPRRRGGHP